jgi:hypothetical protein
MKRMAVVVSEVVAVNDGGSSTPTEQSLAKSMVKTTDIKVNGKAVDEKRSKRLYQTMTELINRVSHLHIPPSSNTELTFLFLYKALPALTKAFEYVFPPTYRLNISNIFCNKHRVLEKMINHLHFLPLTTTLLAISSRLFVITIDISAYVIQYRAATQNVLSDGQSGVRSLQPGNSKDKNRDNTLLQLEDVVAMMITGRMSSDKISTAQELLEAKLSALQDSTANADTRKVPSVINSLANAGATMMEMDGEDFGEAVALPRSVTSPRITFTIRAPPTSNAPVVLDPPSSPEEIVVAPLPSRKTFSESSSKTPTISSESGRSEGLLTAIFHLDQPVGGKVPPSPLRLVDKAKGKKQPVENETTSTAKPSKRSSAGTAISDPRSAGDTIKKKKKKGKDLMDDIFGL